MATLSQWVAGARPRTLPAAIAPVVLGTAAAHLLDRADPALAILALVVALALQVGVNYANDYSDGIRGTDGPGSARCASSASTSPPRNVKLAAFLFFGARRSPGWPSSRSQRAWLMLPLGALAVLAAWKYTGGDNPYGYRGLGEVYVFVFFGLMATLGTLYTQAAAVSWFGVLGAVGVGAIASAILVANNLRDIPTDTEHGKQTLAVRLGDHRTRLLYVVLVAVSRGRPAPHGALSRGRCSACSPAARRAAARPCCGRHGARPRPRARRDRALRDRVCRARAVGVVIAVALR